MTVGPLIHISPSSLNFASLPVSFLTILKYVSGNGMPIPFSIYPNSLKRITGHEKNTIPITGVFGELTPHTDYNFLAAPSFGFGTSFKAENKSRGGTVITTTKNTQGTTTEYKFYNIGFEGSESSFDLFTTTSSNGITTKTMFGVDGDYFFFGYDTEADINSYGTMGGYARYNVHKYIVYTALATAALFVTIKYVVPAAEHAVLALIPYTGPTIIHALQHACS